MSVLSEFKEAIAIQQRKENESFEEQRKLPIEERVAKGIAIQNVAIHDILFYDGFPDFCGYLALPKKYIKGMLVNCIGNISNFKEGDKVILGHGNLNFKMEIIEDLIDQLVLIPDNFSLESCYLDSETYPKNNWEINKSNESITAKLLSSTAFSLENDSDRNMVIQQIFSGKYEIKYQIKNTYSHLNLSQNNAISKAIGTSKFHLIQGPPGTGKTATIAHLSKELLENGKKVFVTGFTHTSINNCLNAISKLVKDKEKVIKIGESVKAKEIKGNEFITLKDRIPLQNKNEFEGGIIIGGTSYSLCYPASKRLNNWEFDVVIIDEASQLSIPLAIAVMAKSDKHIFVGDHKQLGPILPEDTNLSLLEGSIFNRLANLYPSNISLLDVTYRLNKDLTRIPNKLFYDDKLISHQSTSKSEQQFESVDYNEVLNHHDSKLLFLHKVFDSQGKSEHEAKIVARLVNDLLVNGISKEDIGIISPYRAQVREIRRALNSISSIKNSTEISEIFVDTVDRMQGQERDYIIYSMSNSHPLESKRRLDFFYSPNRLNVAITRAKKKCIVIANYKVFDIIDEELIDFPEFNKLKPSLDIFKEYFKLSHKIEEEIEEDIW